MSKCPCGQEGINLQLGRYLHTSSLEASGTLHQVTKDGWIGTYTYTPTSPQERAQWSLSK